MRYFYMCLRENFKSPLTYAAIVIFSILCIFGMSFTVDKNTYTFFEVFSNEKLFETLKLDSKYSSYLLAFQFSNFNWYTVGLAVLTAIPALYTYVKSLEKVQNFALFRTSYRKYTVGTILSAFLIGAIITIAGFLLFASAVYIVFPSFESFDNDFIKMFYGETAGERLLKLAKNVLNNAVVGGIIPVFAITLYRFIRSDFLAASIPVMIMYISFKIVPNYRAWFSDNPDSSNNAFLQLLFMLFPSNLINLGYSFEYTLKAPLFLAYLFFAAIVFACCLLFKKSVRRA